MRKVVVLLAVFMAIAMVAGGVALVGMRGNAVPGAASAPAADCAAFTPEQLEQAVVAHYRRELDGGRISRESGAFFAATRQFHRDAFRYEAGQPGRWTLPFTMTLADASSPARYTAVVDCGMRVAVAAVQPQ